MGAVLPSLKRRLVTTFWTERIRSPTVAPCNTTAATDRNHSNVYRGTCADSYTYTHNIYVAVSEAVSNRQQASLRNSWSSILRTLTVMAFPCSRASRDVTSSELMSRGKSQRNASSSNSATSCLALRATSTWDNAASFAMLVHDGRDTTPNLINHASRHVHWGGCPSY